MFNKNIKIALFGILFFFVLLIPFAGMNIAEAVFNKKMLTEEECFEQIIESIAEQEEKLELKELRNQVESDSKFKELKNNNEDEFKNTIQYWKADPEKCIVKLSKIDIKYNIDKDTEDHIELVVSVDADSRKILKAELQEPYKVEHTNYVGNRTIWAGITQMDGSSEHTSFPTAVNAYFDVPYPSDPSQLNCGIGTNKCIVSAWSGLSEDWGGSDTMIQSGIDSVCEGDNCANGRSYNAWLEKIDTEDSRDVCKDLTVNSGDSIRVFTSYSNKTHKYSTGVYSFDEHDICSISYKDECEHAHYGQFMVERPSFSKNPVPLPSFPDFDMKGKISIGGIFKGIGDYNTLGKTWNHNMKNSGTTNIKTSWPNSTDYIHFNYISSSGAN